MKTIYYSELLNKHFDSVDACEKAEAEYKAKVAAEQEKATKLKSERAARAKAIEEAYKAKLAADKNYAKLVNEFINDYGSFHMSLSSTIPSFVDLIEFLF